MSVLYSFCIEVRVRATDPAPVLHSLTDHHAEEVTRLLQRREDGNMSSIIWICALLGIVPGVIAKNKGHSFGLWWLFGAVLFPVALPLAFVVKPSPLGISQMLFPRIGKRILVPVLETQSLTPPAWRPSR
jgi:hypothetical protein